MLFDCCEPLPPEKTTTSNCFRSMRPHLFGGNAGHLGLRQCFEHVDDVVDAVIRSTLAVKDAHLHRFGASGGGTMVLRPLTSGGMTKVEFFAFDSALRSFLALRRLRR
jgi:hypothetical protein